MPEAWASQAIFASSGMRNWVTKYRPSTTKAGTYATWNAAVLTAVRIFPRGRNTRYAP